MTPLLGLQKIAKSEHFACTKQPRTGPRLLEMITVHAERQIPPSRKYEYERLPLRPSRGYSSTCLVVRSENEDFDDSIFDEQSLEAESNDRKGLLSLPDESIAKIMEFVLQDEVDGRSVLSLPKFYKGCIALSTVCRAFSRIVKLANPLGINCADVERELCSQELNGDPNYLKQREVFRWPVDEGIVFEGYTGDKLLIYNDTKDSSGVHIVLVGTGYETSTDSEKHVGVGVELPLEDLVRMFSAKDKDWSEEKLKGKTHKINLLEDASVENSGMLNRFDIYDNETRAYVEKEPSHDVCSIYMWPRKVGSAAEAGVSLVDADYKAFVHFLGKFDSAEDVNVLGFIPEQNMVGLRTKQAKRALECARSEVDASNLLSSRKRRAAALHADRISNSMVEQENLTLRNGAMKRGAGSVVLNEGDKRDARIANNDEFDEHESDDSDEYDSEYESEEESAASTDPESDDEESEAVFSDAAASDEEDEDEDGLPFEIKGDSYSLVVVED